MNKETDTQDIATTKVHATRCSFHILLSTTQFENSQHTRRALAEECRYRIQTNCAHFTKTLPRSGAKQVTRLHQFDGAAAARSHAIAGRRLRTLSSSCYQTQFRSHDYALYVAPPPPPTKPNTYLYNAFQKHTSEAQIISRATRALAAITAGTAALRMFCSRDVVRK
jgi:hypothetical protein